jgi:AcrR family transcriptional regulator
MSAESNGARSGVEMRERRRRRMAADIERVALELFAERGFDEVTVDDIAAAADISPRTFFRYFPNKEDVLLGDPRRDEQILVEALDRQPQGTAPLDALHAALLVLAGGHDADAATTRLRMQLLEALPDISATLFSQRLPYHQRLTPMVARRMGVEDPADMRPALVVSLSLSAMYVAIGQWIRAGGAVPLSQVMAEALAGAAAGLSALTAPAESSRVPPGR